MSQVSMTINGRLYRLTCEDGEEQRLAQLGDEVRARVDEFSNSFGQVGEVRLLLLAALRLADELFDARDGKEGQPRASQKAQKAAGKDQGSGKRRAVKVQATKAVSIEPTPEKTKKPPKELQAEDAPDGDAAPTPDEQQDIAS